MTRHPYLTSAVLSAYTGKVLTAPSAVGDLLHDLTGESGTFSAAVLPGALAAVRRELGRQFPWLSDDLTVSDAVCEHGISVEVETDTPLLDIPGPAVGLPAGVTLIRMAKH